MNWQQNLSALAQLAGDGALIDDPDFLALMPTVVLEAQNRIIRDLDLLSTRVTDDTGKLTLNRKLFILPTDVGNFVVLEQLRVILPPPPGSPAGATGIYTEPLLPSSKDCIDSLWPAETAVSSPSIPTLWCPNDEKSVFVGPPPDMSYLMSCFGTQRPAPLSPTTAAPGTFISTEMADLFLAAEMMWISAQQRNWSATSDDPQMALGWSQEYARLMKSAAVEEARKKLQSVGWSARLPEPTVDTPPAPRP